MILVTKKMYIVVCFAVIFCGCSKPDRKADPGDSIGIDSETAVQPWHHEWKAFEDMPDCQHVEVIEDCTDGWCRIPKGCFVMGSPENEWGRSPILENQLTVILDQSFEIMQYETTLKQWKAAGFQVPERNPGDVMTQPECLEEGCPVDNVGWWAAVTYANKLSEVNGFEPCYQLQGCSGVVGQQAYACESVTPSVPTLYECAGYRLPTEAEWEYAARAGTQTSYYAGPSQPTESTGDCSYQPYLAGIAWYCYNSEDRLHPVGQKTANGWGLYDILGNSWEWTNDVGGVPLPEGPVHNLNAELTDNSMRTIRGGLYYAMPASVTANTRIGTSTASNTAITGFGFRLVRTLNE